MVHSIDPAVWEDPTMRGALATRDIATVYRGLRRHGFTQRQIAEMTGQSQGEVSEIVKGRKVVHYDVLVKIVEGLGVSRGWLGMAYCGSATYAEQRQPIGEVDDEDEAVRRRQTLAFATTLVFGYPLLGEAVEPRHVVRATPLPDRITKADVYAVQSLTERLRALGRAGHGGMPEIMGQAVAWRERLLEVDGSPLVHRRLRSALAEMHLLAGWACHDMNLPNGARYHYSRAMTLAGSVDDLSRVIAAVRDAAGAAEECGALQHSLKLLELGTYKLMGVSDEDPDKPTHQIWLHLQSAVCLALMDNPEHVERELGRAAEHPWPDDPFERANLDYVRAGIDLTLGRIDTAEQYATAAARTWDDAAHLRDVATAWIRRAEIHTITGEQGAPELAHQAIEAVGQLRSARARAKLVGLETALTVRGDSTSLELAHQARQLHPALA